VEFRPILPSDEFSSRNFFYSLKEETIYSRFFHKVRIFSHEMVQKQWAHVDYRKNISIIGLAKRGGNMSIVAIGSYAHVDEDTAEVAFVVRENYQGMGIASYLLEVLEEIARENNYKKFFASVLRTNASMIHVFKKRYPNAKILNTGGTEIDIEMTFDLEKAEAKKEPLTLEAE
jgi:GNAT superfamily N-acetyltransferase